MRPAFLSLLAFVLAVLPLSAIANPSAAVPAWLRAHEGTGAGQIAPVVLDRARALYLAKRASGEVRNPCYLAMDATRPNYAPDGQPGRRFYVICEATRSFRAMSAGHGAGRRLAGVADFTNGRRCARNFGNAAQSMLTAGGDYLTAEADTGFMGYYRDGGRLEPLSRTFIRFDGEGETANARARAIGGHAAELIRRTCRLKDPASPYADARGYVPFGLRVSYPAGRSNGCTSWAAADAARIAALVRDDPTTLYIYPEAADIGRVARAEASGRVKSAPYWNASCLSEIRAPKFWDDARLGPVIARYDRDHPRPPPRPLPLCPGQ